MLSFLSLWTICGPVVCQLQGMFDRILNNLAIAIANNIIMTIIACRQSFVYLRTSKYDSSGRRIRQIRVRF